MTNGRIAREEWIRRKIAGWTSVPARIVTGLTLFLAASGLLLWGGPFTVFGQHALLLHTALGILFLFPLGVYLVRHVRAYWEYPFTHLKGSGWLLGAVLALCCVSGVVLTGEGALGTRISYAWRTVHVATTFGLLLLLVAHLAPLLWRQRKDSLAPEAETLGRAIRGHSRAALAIGSVAMLATGGLAAWVRPVPLHDEFPADYETPYEGGAARPFAPSLSTTKSGGAYDIRSLTGSKTCGTSGCHEQIYAEWTPSAHRYASMDAGFQAIQKLMAQQNGPVSTRYCGGCHDPGSLFSGTKNLGVENLTSLPGYQEGVACLSCHAIQQTDVKGNASYVIAPPERYVYELREGGVASFLSNFLIRTWPDHHVKSLSRRMFKSPEFCGACHKQFIDQEVNKVGWVQLQNQYDNWRASRWNHAGDPRQTIECRECHMPLVDSSDPAAGDAVDFNRTAGDGKHRSHRFLGANQLMPALLHLDGGEKQIDLVQHWLRGEIPVPEIADRWRQGPAVPIEIEAPKTATAGDPVTVKVHVVNNKVGHDFPTGPLDIIQAWVEVLVTDPSGREVFHSGGVDDRHFIQTGTYMFKAEPVDRYGNLIDKHNLWEMVGVRFRRTLFPGSEEVAPYTFDCSSVAAPAAPATLPGETVALDVPADAQGELHVQAKLNYRKFDQYLLNFAFGEKSGLTAPVTLVASAETTIRIRGR